jgi:hypothetical protein
MVARQRSSSRQKAVRQPEWAEYKRRWWWKDPQDEEAWWHPKEEFNQKEWDRLRREEKKEVDDQNVQTSEEKAAQEAKTKVKQELTLARSSAASATKAWGHDDPTSRSLVNKVDGLYDQKRAAELKGEEHVDALNREMENMAKRFTDIESEEKRMSARMLLIASEKSYMIERGAVLKDRRDKLRAELESAAAASTATPSASGAGTAAVASGSTGSVGSSPPAFPPVQPPSQHSDQRVANLEAQMSGVAGQLAQIMSAIQCASGAPRPTGGGWEADANWSDNGWGGWDERPQQGGVAHFNMDTEEQSGHSTPLEYPAEYMAGFEEAVGSAAASTTLTDTTGTGPLTGNG